MAEARPNPADCPQPFWHETHRYCPICTWAEPVGEAGLSRVRDALASIIEDYMTEGGEFRAYDLADRIIRRLDSSEEIVLRTVEWSGGDESQ